MMRLVRLGEFDCPRRMKAMGHERSPRLDDSEGSTAVVREVRQMSAIGTEEPIDVTQGVVGLLGCS